MAPNPKLTEIKIDAFAEGWKEHAEDASFYGMTLAQFQAKTKASIDARDTIRDLEQQLATARIERDNADPASLEVIANVVNAVKGDKNHGEDSALYASFGYVRKSARKSGLKRNSKHTTTPMIKVAA